MSKKSDIAKIEKIYKYILDIEKIVVKHKTIDKAIDDLEGQYAITMCLVQIGELMGKIESEEICILLPIREANDFRNIIVHNYDGLEFSMVKKTIKESIPVLEEAVLKMINSDKMLF